MLGTRHVLDAAVRYGAERVVFVSSDKAADPTSVFGATMRLGELLLRTATPGPTCFAAVRVGNVIGEAGPLLSLLAHRITSGEIVTITHPEVARHFMTVQEAAGLLIEAAAMAEEAETFVLDMGLPVPVVDLVHRYAEQLRLPEVTIRFSGPGPARSPRRRRSPTPSAGSGPRIPRSGRPAPPRRPPGSRSCWTSWRPRPARATTTRCGCCCAAAPEYHPVRRPEPVEPRRPGRPASAARGAAPTRPACEVCMGTTRKLKSPR